MRTVQRHDQTIRVRLYLTSDDAFNAIIAVDIAVITDRCDLAVDLAGLDRSDQECGPSAFGRKWTTARRWLVAVNTTPTTPMASKLPQLSFIARASLHLKPHSRASTILQVPQL